MQTIARYEMGRGSTAAPSAPGGSCAGRRGSSDAGCPAQHRGSDSPAYFRAEWLRTHEGRIPGPCLTTVPNRSMGGVFTRGIWYGVPARWSA